MTTMYIRRIFCGGTLLFLSIAQPVKAQVMGSFTPFLSLGVKAGGGFQTLSGGPVKAAPVALGGIYMNKKLGRVGVRAELLGSYVSYTTKNPASFYSLYAPGMDTLNKGKFNVIAVNVPLLVEYQLREHLDVIAGVQFGYNVNVSDANGAYTSVYGNTDFLKASDFGIVAGVEHKITKKFHLGARILKGINDVNDSKYYLKPKSWTTTGIQVSASYKLF